MFLSLCKMLSILSINDDILSLGLLFGGKGGVLKLLFLLKDGKSDCVKTGTELHLSKC
jgi:hypothetical protein